MRKKKVKKVQLYGSALHATLKAMQILGNVGNEILKSNKAEIIEDDRLYSTTLRSTLYDSLFERYGESALKAIGFAMGEIWAPIAADRLKQSIESSSKKKIKFSKNDLFVHPFSRKRTKLSLDNFVIFYTGIWDSAIKQYSFTEDLSYEAYSEKLGSFRYKIILKSPGTRKRHIALIQENLDGIIFPFLVREWDHEFIWDSSNTKQDMYGCKFVFTLEFKKKKKPGNFLIETANKKSRITGEFLQSVLEYSEKQRNKLENLSGKLGKYIPPQIHKSLFSGKYDTAITTKRKKLTIFFSDISNFTSTSEGLQPEDLTKYLNEYFSEMTSIALEKGATIDKYIGDAMMVFFGDPESKGEREDARSCVEMALRMQERMIELQKKWKDEGFADPFQIRMGLNTGYCNVGNFGSEQRLTYTIIGGEVNVAQRLEASASANGILMSYETYAHAQDKIDVEKQESINMKGISREIKVFSVKNRKRDKGQKNQEIKKVEPKIEKSEIEKLKNDLESLKTNMFLLNKKMENLQKKI